jgi:UPF0755 protein
VSDDEQDWDLGGGAGAGGGAGEGAGAGEGVSQGQGRGADGDREWNTGQVFDTGEVPVEGGSPIPGDDVVEGGGSGENVGRAARRRVRQGDEATTVSRHELRRRRVRRRRLLGLVGAAVVVIVLAFGFWYELQSHALGPAGKREIVQVTSGESMSSIASQLSVHHVIGSTLAFRLFNLVHGSPTVVPGDYELRGNETFAQVHAALAAGPNIYTVTINRGQTLSEVATQVDGLPGHPPGAFTTAANSGAVHSEFSPAGSNDLEGMLGTGSYLVVPGESDTTLLTAMVNRFDAQATAAGLSTASASALGMTPYQVITVASIVEKEGYYFKNMPDVARVIYNRLATGTPLQMNSTVFYPLGQDGGVFTTKDRELQSPYNTYLNTGLPPTPICSPSPQALSAAVHPPPGAWLYFVLVSKDGTEAFSVTYAEQLANEKLAKERGVG